MLRPIDYTYKLGSKMAAQGDALSAFLRKPRIKYRVYKEVIRKGRLRKVELKFPDNYNATCRDRQNNAHAVANIHLKSGRTIFDCEGVRVHPRLSKCSICGGHNGADKASGEPVSCGCGSSTETIAVAPVALKGRPRRGILKKSISKRATKKVTFSKVAATKEFLQTDFVGKRFIQGVRRR